MSQPVHIIAEAGTNHDAKLEQGKVLIDVAKQAGADSVKFQIIYPEGLYLPEFHENGGYRRNEVFDKRAAGMLSDDAYRTLAKYGRDTGIPVSASAFDDRGLKLLDSLDPPYIKIASPDLNNSRMLKAAASYGRKLVVSTGYASLAEIERAVTDIVATGHRDLVLLHCVSIYPCPFEATNLGFIDVLRSAFGFPVGFSDHTESSLAAVIAVAKGATWLEKHFTIDRSLAGFDHGYAMSPAMLASYVADVRAATEACSTHVPKVGAEESRRAKMARRSVYAARDITAGATIGDADLVVVRPEGPLAPNESAVVAGRRARRAFGRYEPLRLEDTE